MEALHKLRISSPYEILKIEDIKISCIPNEHGYLYLKCLIDDSINFKYSIEASTEDKIILYEELEDKDKSIIFNGIIQNVRTTNENGIYYLELEAASSSFLLDVEVKTRSFQDAEMSYDNLINEILKDYSGYGFTQCMSKPMSIGKPLFQYKETDYEFLKRVASLLGLEVICDIINLNNLFYFGRPQGEKYTIKDGVNYRACKDLERYHKIQALGIDFHDTDFFYYEIEKCEKMDIGDKIYFKQKDLYVNQYEAKLHKGDLIYKYKFCRERGIWQDKIYNQKIRGVSLEGKVLETDGEKLKIHLNIDENQDPSKAAWFYYAPPSGNILYSMPLVNESAMLYFQDIIDAAPIVTNCVRKNGDTCAEVANTDNRYFITESGNHLDILPGAINFHRSGFNVNLNDKNGITFSSSGNLSIGASGSVNLSGGSVSINATSKLLVQKGKSSYISLENEFYAEASVVYENGSARDSYGAFSDDEPTAGAAEALAKKKVAESIEFAVGLLASAMAGSRAIIGGTKNDVNSLPEYDPLAARINENKWTRVKKKGASGDYFSGKIDKFGSFIPDDPHSFSDNGYDAYKKDTYDYAKTHKTTEGKYAADYEVDAYNVHNGPWKYKLKALGDYIDHRFPIADIFGETFKISAISNGMDPEIAEKYGDAYGSISAGMVLEFGATISITGLKSARNLSKDIISERDIIVGSGFGNVPKGGSKADILKQNRINGRDFEVEALNKMKGNADNVVEQITVKSKSGTRTRLDAIGVDKNTGEIIIQEYKASPSAPLTKNQKIAHPEILTDGGVIIGKGKPPFIGGTEIPPTKIEIIRKK